MSNWVALSTADLDAASVAGKVARIRAIAAGKGLPDPAPAAIARVVEELRAMIGFSVKYKRDVAPTKIPAGMVQLAVLKVVRECAKTVSFPLNDDEKSDERTYESRLGLIRQGQYPIEPADNPESTPGVQTSVVTPSVTPRPRQFWRGGAYG